MNAKVVILGIGRPGFGDDAAGLLVADRLRRLRGSTCQVLTDPTGGWNALDTLGNADLLVVIDAAEAGPRFPPGEWRRLEYPKDADALVRSGLRSTHSLSVDALLRLADSLGQLPPRVWIYAIAAEHFSPETTVSSPVVAALDTLADRIAADLHLPPESDL